MSFAGKGFNLIPARCPHRFDALVRLEITMLTEKDILYETKGSKFWVMKAEKAYEVYETGITHSTRKVIVGLSLGLERAIAYADRLQAKFDESNEQK
jgi:hypothetical protein